jgi:hypothetical protein
MNFTNANLGNGTNNNVDTSTFNSAGKGAINLSSVSTITLSGLVMDTGVQTGVNGQNVSALTITNCTIKNFGDNVNEDILRLFNLTGTCSFTNSTFQKPGEFLVDLRNNGAAAALTLTIDNVVFDDTASAAFGAAGLSVTSAGANTVTVNVDNSTFTKIKNAAYQVMAKGTSILNTNITDSIMDPSGGVGGGIGRGPDLAAQDSAQLNFNVNHNVKIYSKNGTAINIYSFGTSAIQGRVNGNPDIRSGGVGSPGTGISIQPQDNSTAKVEVKNNVISQIGSTTDAGIRLLSFGNGSTLVSPQLDGTVSGNTITLINNGVSGAGYVGGLFGIQAQGGSNGTPAPLGDQAKTAVDISNNTVSATPLAINNSDMIAFRARVGSAGSFLYLAGFNTNATTTWNNKGNTPLNSVSQSVAAGGTIAAIPAGAPYNGQPRPPTNATALMFAPANSAPQVALEPEVIAPVAPPDSTIAAPESTSVVAVPPTTDIDDGKLTAEKLAVQVQIARSRWEATGLTDRQLSALRALRFEIGDLPGRYIGSASGGTIQLSRNAGGHGWFIERTGAGVDSTTPGNRVDLLTAIMHEMGHALGFLSGTRPQQPDVRFPDDRRAAVAPGWRSKGCYSRQRDSHRVPS